MPQTTYNIDMTQGFPGMVDPASDPHFRSMRNDGAGAVAFGTAVQFEDLTDPSSASNLDAIDNRVAGMVAHTHAHDELALDATGVLPGNKLDVMVSGRMLVQVEEAVQPGDRVHLRALAGTPGAVRISADGVNTIDSTGQGVVDSVADAAGLAWVRFDFRNLPA